MTIPASDTPALDLADVAKTYRKTVRALDGITMRVERGEIFGLLGPNGAGKSTLVKILMTVIRPTRCRGTLLGRPVGDKAALARVGYLPEHHRFPEYLTGAQVIDHYGAMSGVPRRERRARAGALLDLVGMTGWAGTRVKQYSKGMRQRIGIAQALANDPELVLLDEPTDGVDPVGRRDIRAVLTTLKEQGKTVFLNSHLLSELEMLCDRVAILVQGRVSQQGTIADLTRGSRRYEIEATVEGGPAALRGALSGVQSLRFTDGSSPPPVLTAASANGSAARAARGGGAGEVFRGSLGATPVEIEGGVIRVATDDAAAVQPLIDALRARGVTISAVRPVRASLEDLFMLAVTDPATGRALDPGAEMPGGGRGGGPRRPMEAAP